MSTARWKAITAVVTNPFSRDQLAATKAAAIAARCGARLTLFNTFMMPQPVPDVPVDSSEEIIASAIRLRSSHLEKLASRFRRRGIATKCEVVWDFPAHEAIVRHVLEAKPDLLVAESHRHGRVARWVLANTDWELIRSCPCPLWFVRSPQLPRRAQVLVAVDPRHTHAKPARLDDRLLAAAQSLVDQAGGDVSIAHAYESPASATAGALAEPTRPPISPERTREFVEATATSVHRLATKHHIALENCHVREGSASDVLSRLVKRCNVDVLVMGAVSRSLPMRPVIGNTAERIIDQVDCDVFIVKPAGFRTPVTRVRPSVTARSRASPASRWQGKARL